MTASAGLLARSAMSLVERMARKSKIAGRHGRWHVCISKQHSLAGPDYRAACSGNSPGIQRLASRAGKASCSGARVVSAVMTPSLVRADRTRLA